MRNLVKAAVVVTFVVVALLAWAPWITDDFAVSRVVEKLGGPEVIFHYLNEDLPIREIPKEVSWLPFGRFVTFPSEAGWFVSFFGSVN